MHLSWQQAIGFDQSHLTHFSMDEKRSFLIHSKITDDLRRLLEAASKAELEITLISSFRSFERQLTLWNQKWLGNLKLYSQHGQLIDSMALSDEEKFHAISLWSALPGLSRHHWGTDIDIFSASAVAQGHRVQLVPQEFIQGGVCGTLNQWLDENLEAFGFFRPYKVYQQGIAAEPWHISHQEFAESIRQEFPFEACIKHLTQSGIMSFELVDQLFDHYCERYFNNICTPMSGH